MLVSIKAVWIWCINDLISWLFTYNNFNWNYVRSWVCFWVRGQKVFTFLLLLHCWLNGDLQTTLNKNWNVTTVSRVCERASPLHPETVFVKAFSLLISDFKLTFSAFKRRNLYLHSEVDYNLLLHMVLDSDIFLQLLTELLLVIMWMIETGIVNQLSFEHTILPAHEVVSLSSWNPAHLLIIFHKPSWPTAEINGKYFLPNSERRIQSCVSSYFLFLKCFLYLECHACRSCLLLHQHMVKF